MGDLYPLQVGAAAIRMSLQTKIETVDALISNEPYDNQINPQVLPHSPSVSRKENRSNCKKERTKFDLAVAILRDLCAFPFSPVGSERLPQVSIT